jgi:hypothetical protein
MSDFSVVSHRLFAEECPDLLRLSDEGRCLTLLLSANGSKFSLSFDSHLFYSKADEGDSLRLLAQMKRDGCLGSTLIQVKNSALISWFVTQSYEVRRESELSHYVVLTQNDVVNIICTEPPIVEVGRRV